MKRPLTFEAAWLVGIAGVAGCLFAVALVGSCQHRPVRRGVTPPVLLDGGVGLCPMTRPIYCPEFGICVFEECPR